MMLFITISVFTLIAWIDGINVYDKEKKPVFVTYVIILAGAFVLQFLIDMNVKIPSPAGFLENIVKIFVKF